MRAVVVGVCAALMLASPALAAKVSLSGEITYEERIGLPEDAILEIQLVDQTLPSAPPRVDVRAAIGAGQVPLSFALGFEDSIVIPGHSYALIASISNASGLLFRNFEPYVVDPLAPAGPVVIVTSLVGDVVTPGASSTASEAPEATPPLAILDTTWRAIEISDIPVLPRTVPSLLIGSDMRAGGSGGCNSWFAQAQLDGDTLRLGSITSTQKGCTQSVNLQEQAFRAALAAAVLWRVDGDELSLFGSDGKILLRLRR